MKKILVLSDSHGNVNNMVTAVRNTHPDQIIHLGDCWVDAEKLHWITALWCTGLLWYFAGGWFKQHDCNRCYIHGIILLTKVRR